MVVTDGFQRPDGVALVLSANRHFFVNIGQTACFFIDIACFCGRSCTGGRKSGIRAFFGGRCVFKRLFRTDTV
jgi:hypothetical protein